MKSRFEPVPANKYIFSISASNVCCTACHFCHRQVALVPLIKLLHFKRKFYNNLAHPVYPSTWLTWIIKLCIRRDSFMPPLSNLASLIAASAAAATTKATRLTGVYETFAEFECWFPSYPYKVVNVHEYLHAYSNGHIVSSR